MKRIVTVTIVLVALMFSVNARAQEVAVAPGYGTLNDAVSQYGGTKTYKLQAGGWYGLSAVLNNVDPLVVIGEVPAAGQMPAIIQTGSNPDGSTFGAMFAVGADVTMKNVFIVNADLNDSRGAIVFNQLSDSRITLDAVTVDPIGSWMLINSNANYANTHLTNSLFMRHSSGSSGIYDYPFLNYAGASGYDTLYVENCTFLDMGFSFYNALVSFQRGSEAPDNFIWFNHNSFIFGKSDLLNAFYTKSTFFTNNLMWEWGAQPYTNDFSIWFLNFGDQYPNNTRTCMIKADTLKSNGISEAFPSQRKYFVAYNYNFRDPRINDLIKVGADAGHTSYTQYLVTPPEFKSSSREAVMFDDKTNFPYFLAVKNTEDQPNTDPKFVDQKIYALTDSAVAWANASTKLFWGFPEGTFPPRESWANYYYNTDTADGFPVTWPRFNGAYTNSSLLTGSIEGLPLGDLNWYPAQKTLWQNNQAKVMAHILSLDPSVINITAIRDAGRSALSFSLEQNYPNPFNPSTEIKYSVPSASVVSLKIFNLLGQEITTLVNQEQKAGTYSVNFNASKLSSGMYIYRLQAGENTITKKMTLIK